MLHSSTLPKSKAVGLAPKTVDPDGSVEVVALPFRLVTPTHPAWIRVVSRIVANTERVKTRDI